MIAINFIWLETLRKSLGAKRDMLVLVLGGSETLDFHQPEIFSCDLVAKNIVHKVVKEIYWHLLQKLLIITACPGSRCFATPAIKYNMLVNK